MVIKNGKRYFVGVFLKCKPIMVNAIVEQVASPKPAENPISRKLKNDFTLILIGTEIIQIITVIAIRPIHLVETNYEVRPTTTIKQHSTIMNYLLNKIR